jgi:Domain of unknown function (DUF4440)
MKRIFAILLAGAALAAWAYLRGADKLNERDEQQVLKFEQEWADASVRRDTVALERIEADDYTLTDSAGTVWTKAQDISNYKDGTLQFDSLKNEDLRVRIYIGGAVVTGRSVVKGKFKEADISGEYRFIDVLENKNNRWQAVFTQLTKVPKP